MLSNYYLNQKIGWQPLTGIDGFGKGIFGPQVVMRARFESKRDIVVGNNGENISTDSTVFIKPNLAMKEGDLIWYRDESYRIVKAYDEYRRRQHWHKQIWLQKWQQR